MAYYDDDFNRTGFILHTLLTIQLSTMSISVLFMAFFHLNLALSNSTTYEKIVSMRAHYGHYHLHSHKCGSESKSEDPNHIEFSGPEVVNYNQGLWRNIISYLRREFPVEWLYTHAAPLEFQDECSQIV